MISHKVGKHKTFKSKSRKSRKLPLAIGLLNIIVVVTAVFYLFAMNKQPTETETKVLLQTSMGDIIIQLRDDKPITTNNFKNLVQQGVYDGTIFHRVIADFMIQGGQNPNVTVTPISDEIGNYNHNYRG